MFIAKLSGTHTSVDTCVGVEIKSYDVRSVNYLPQSFAQLIEGVPNKITSIFSDLFLVMLFQSLGLENILVVVLSSFGTNTLGLFLCRTVI